MLTMVGRDVALLCACTLRWKAGSRFVCHTWVERARQTAIVAGVMGAIKGWRFLLS